MPSSATITAFHTMVANTKARASQANTNWSNFRGHMVPIEPLTATASDLTYDLGASDHRWRAAYLQSIDFQSSTTTAGLVLVGDTSNTAGAFLFKVAGATVAKVLSSGFDGAYLKLLSVATGAINDLAVTTGKINDLAVTAGKKAALSYSQDPNADSTVTSTSFVSLNLAINFSNTRPIIIMLASDPTTSRVCGGAAGMQIAVDRAASNIAYANIAPNTQTTHHFKWFYAGTGNATYTIVGKSIDGSVTELSNYLMTIYEL